MRKRNEKLDVPVLLRVTNLDFDNDTDAKLFFEYQKKLSNNGKLEEFNKNSIIKASMLQVNDEADKFKKLLHHLDTKGIDCVLKKLETESEKISESEMDNISKKIVEKLMEKDFIMPNNNDVEKENLLRNLTQEEEEALNNLI